MEKREGSIENVQKYVLRKFSFHHTTNIDNLLDEWNTTALWWSSFPFGRFFFHIILSVTPPYRSYFPKIPVSDNDELTYSDIQQKQLADCGGPWSWGRRGRHTFTSVTVQFVQAQQSAAQLLQATAQFNWASRKKYSSLLKRRNRRHQRRGDPLSTSRQHLANGDLISKLFVCTISL